LDVAIPSATVGSTSVGTRCSTPARNAASYGAQRAACTRLGEAGIGTEQLGAIAERNDDEPQRLRDDEGFDPTRGNSIVTMAGMEEECRGPS
jgi:hypothetical protein